MKSGLATGLRYGLAIAFSVFGGGCWVSYKDLSATPRVKQSGIIGRRAVLLADTSLPRARGFVAFWDWGGLTFKKGDPHFSLAAGTVLRVSRVDRVDLFLAMEHWTNAVAETGDAVGREVTINGAVDADNRGQAAIGGFHYILVPTEEAGSVESAYRFGQRVIAMPIGELEAHVAAGIEERAADPLWGRALAARVLADEPGAREAAVRVTLPKDRAVLDSGRRQVDLALRLVADRERVAAATQLSWPR